MQNDENTNAIEVETKDDVAAEVEDTEADSAADESQSDEADDTKDEGSELAKAKAEAAKYRRLFEKTQKQKPANADKADEKPQKPSAPDVEEVVLKANGMPDALLKTLKKVAALNGTSLLDAQNDELFIAAKSKHEREEKERKASMGASRGSGRTAPKTDFNTPGLTEEQHRALWERS